MSILAYIQRLSACVLYQLYKAQVLPGSSQQGVVIGSVVTTLAIRHSEMTQRKWRIPTRVPWTHPSPPEGGSMSQTPKLSTSHTTLKSLWVISGSPPQWCCYRMSTVSIIAHPNALHY